MMNGLNVTSDDTTLLEEYAAKKRVEFIPAMIFVAVFIIAGVIGNVFSFVYYGFKVKRIPSTIFISVLSAVDFFGSIIMSSQIINLYHYTTFKSIAGCRIYRFLSHWVIFGSVFLLVVISIDRYRKLCAPFKRQFTLVSSKVAIAISMVASVLLAVKTDFIIDVQHVNITNAENKTFQGYQCFHTTHASMSKLVAVSNLIDFIVPMTIVVFFIVIYGLIIRNIARIKSKTLKVPDIRAGKCGSSDELHTTVLDTRGDKCDSSGELSTKLPVTRGDNCDSSGELSTTVQTKTEAKDITTDLDSGQRYKSNETRVYETHTKDMRPEIKLTVMTFVITVVFILSFIPYFVVILYVNFVLKIPRYELNVGMQIIYRSFVINSSANPYIFLIFNSAFRRFVNSFFQKYICCFFK